MGVCGARLAPRPETRPSAVSWRATLTARVANLPICCNLGAFPVAEVESGSALSGTSSFGAPIIVAEAGLARVQCRDESGFGRGFQPPHCRVRRYAASTQADLHQRRLTVRQSSDEARVTASDRPARRPFDCRLNDIWRKESERHGHPDRSLGLAFSRCERL